ncbi:hypothetical protein [Streptomyces sp. VRA16 Mangrove soil]|uniref:hypothetical protein n=1 Tax=Streptomyces sp. VRA16 Mangrove soil TaxID=2817434 RepID=UPI001E64A031|nr:hypothetical protein [Streptomyces sp. VRA16 Mangrove soil]
MDPHTYARLYSPWRPAAPPPRTGVARLAAAAWTVTALTLYAGTFLVCAVATLMSMGGDPVGGVLRCYGLWLVTGAAVLAAVALLPPVRRLPAPWRRLLLGVLACPLAPMAVAVTWSVAV